MPRKLFYYFPSEVTMNAKTPKCPYCLSIEFSAVKQTIDGVAMVLLVCTCGVVLGAVNAQK